VRSVGFADLTTIFLAAQLVQRARQRRAGAPLGVPHAAQPASAPAGRRGGGAKFFPGLPSGGGTTPSQSLATIPLASGGNDRGRGGSFTSSSFPGETQEQAQENEVAELNSPQGQANIAALRAKVLAKGAQAVAAGQAAAKKSRPSPGSQPATINAWASGGDKVVPPASFFPRGIVDLYPEFHWQPSQWVPPLPGTNGKPTPIAWQGFYQLGSSDWVHWTASNGGQAWSYLHQWGSGFDLLKALKAAYQLCSQGLAWAAHPFSQLATSAYQEINAVLQAVANTLPQPWKGGVEDLKGTIDWLAGQAAMALNDPNGIIQEIPWQDIADAVEAATSSVPLLGTAVSDIVASAELLYQSITAANPLVAAFDAAYDYLMSSVPGLAALDPILQPVLGVLRNIMAGQSLTKAILNEALAQVPDVPSIAGYTPRSIAASLAAFIVTKLAPHGLP